MSESGSPGETETAFNQETSGEDSDAGGTVPVESQALTPDPPPPEEGAQQPSLP